MIKMTPVNLSPTFKGIYGELVPGKKELKQAIQEGASRGIYNSSTDSELKAFRNQLREMAQRQAPKRDVVTFSVLPTKNKDLEPIATQVTYYSPALDGEDIAERDIPRVCQTGLKNLLENKNVIFEVINSRIQQSKDAGSK